MDYQQQLKSIIPGHSYFIGIDSDGCVFDTMEVKQKEFFIPSALKIFDLFSAAKYVRQTWEFVNLYSAYRGSNRFHAFIRVMDLLAERDEVAEAGAVLPDTRRLKEWVSTENRLGNATLKSFLDAHPDPDLEKVLKWSETVNSDIARWFKGLPPFRHALTAIDILKDFADIVVVSQTPIEALEREWNDSGLTGMVRLIAGQEHGTKAEHLSLASKGKYAVDRVLMIGDARGDLEAAKHSGTAFFPIIPGREEESWKRLCEEGITLFTEGNFTGHYSDTLIEEFLKALPATPPWK